MRYEVIPESSEPISSAMFSPIDVESFSKVILSPSVSSSNTPSPCAAKLSSLMFSLTALDCSSVNCSSSVSTDKSSSIASISSIPVSRTSELYSYC